VRHQHAYQRPGAIDWRQDFQTDTEFFDLITSMGLIELADLLNDNDYIEFLQLSLQRIVIPYNFCTDDGIICAKGSKSASLLIET